MEISVARLRALFESTIFMLEDTVILALSPKLEHPGSRALFIHVNYSRTFESFRFLETIVDGNFFKDAFRVQFNVYHWDNTDTW